MPSYQLSDSAEADLSDIIEYTYEQHGQKQTLKYIDALELCAHQLANREGYYKKLTNVHPDLYSTHCQHHYIFGIMRENKSMLVIAILHERMKPMIQLKKRLRHLD